MLRRFSTKERPNSLQRAMEMCLEYALAKHNRSVARVADLMGVQSHTLYKWIGSGRMPSNLIRPFEHACGCHYVTWWVAQSAHKLVIDIPQGKKAGDSEINTLQSSLAHAVGKLIDFYAGKGGANETISALTDVMADLAYHRENVSMHAAPELDLFSHGDAE